MVAFQRRYIIEFSNMDDSAVDGSHRQIGIVLVELFERRSKLGILNDDVGKNAGTTNYGASRHLAGYLFNQITPGSIDIAIHGCHVRTL